MRRVLLSIHPEHANAILDNIKEWEFRKSSPRIDGNFVVVLYATAPVSMIVGEFTCHEIAIDSPGRLWKRTRVRAGIAQAQFDEYFRGRTLGAAWRVWWSQRYPKPRPLSSEAGCTKPPQSWRYLWSHSGRVQPVSLRA